MDQLVISKIRIFPSYKRKVGKHFLKHSRFGTRTHQL